MIRVCGGSAEVTQDDKGTPTKRPAEELHGTPAQLPKMFDMSKHTLNIEDVPKNRLLEISMGMIGLVTAKAGESTLVTTLEDGVKKVYLMNATENIVSFKVNTVILGYGKIKWRYGANEDDLQPSNKEIPYVLENQDTLVLPESQVVTSLKDLVAERRKTNPNVNICYFKFNDDANHAGCFTLTPEQHVRCVFENVKLTEDISNVIKLGYALSTGPVGDGVGKRKEENCRGCAWGMGSFSPWESWIQGLGLGVQTGGFLQCTLEVHVSRVCSQSCLLSKAAWVDFASH